MGLNATFRPIGFSNITGGGYIANLTFLLITIRIHRREIVHLTNITKLIIQCVNWYRVKRKQIYITFTLVEYPLYLHIVPSSFQECNEKCPKGSFELFPCNHTHPVVCKSKLTISSNLLVCMIVWIVPDVSEFSDVGVNAYNYLSSLISLPERCCDVQKFWTGS